MRTILLCFMLFFIVAGTSYADRQYWLNWTAHESWKYLTETNSTLSIATILAIVDVESNFNPNNITNDDYGLFQLNANNLRVWGVSKKLALDPEVNLKCAIDFLNHLCKVYNQRLTDVIQAYNLGETKFNLGARVPAYLKKVLTKRRKYIKMGY